MPWLYAPGDPPAPDRLTRNGRTLGPVFGDQVAAELGVTVDNHVERSFWPLVRVPPPDPAAAYRRDGFSFMGALDAGGHAEPVWVFVQELFDAWQIDQQKVARLDELPAIWADLQAAQTDLAAANNAAQVKAAVEGTNAVLAKVLRLLRDAYGR